MQGISPPTVNEILVREPGGELIVSFKVLRMPTLSPSREGNGVRSVPLTIRGNPCADALDFLSDKSGDLNSGFPVPNR